MTDRSCLRRRAWTVLLFQSVAALCFHGLTLCIGADGHAALGWLADDDCCPQATSTAIVAVEHCNCTDAPLLQPIADKRGSGDDIGHLLPLAALIHPLPAAKSLSFPAALDDPPPSLGVAFRQSVVLQA